MSGSLAELEIEGGISALRCPITGMHVIWPESGFDSDADQSPHLRFFIDWVGEPWVAAPGDLPPEQATYHEEVVSILSAGEDRDPEAMIAECVAVLPKSALVMAILDPPMGSYGGAVCYACFDLGAPALRPRIRLHAVESE